MKGTNGSGAFQGGDSQIELLRAVVLCHPGWASVGPITFAPDKGCSPTWLPWKEKVFAPVLLPAIEEARSACASGDCRALASLDHALDSSLAPELRAGSRVAGSALMEGYSAPKAEKPSADTARSWFRAKLRATLPSFAACAPRLFTFRRQR